VLGPWELLGIPSLSVLGPQVCLETCIRNFQVVCCRKTLGTAWSTLLGGTFLFYCGLGAEEACDETCDPLLDQGLVEVSGSLCFTYFCFRKVRPDSCSFKLSFK
jgi:hypothetical protein